MRLRSTHSASVLSKATPVRFFQLAQGRPLMRAGVVHVGCGMLIPWLGE
jgi:hypothetical protein